jgi:diadenosine tetraphosphate (Ap4A) HIT family hydrolase
MADLQKVVFGQYLVNPSQVFYRSKHCLGLVNLMPVVKGEVILQCVIKTL